MIDFLQAIVGRCDLLGLEALPLLALGADGLLVFAFSAMVARRLVGDRAEPARRLLGCGLTLFAAIVLSATALGAAGMLTRRNLVAVHALLFFLGWLAMRRGDEDEPLRWPWEALRWALAGAIAPLRDLVTRRGWERSRRAESLLVLAIVLILALFAVLAVFDLPLNYDSNTYRLSRIARWIQDGSIRHFPTNEERQGYVGQNADLVMLWLVSFFRRGFPLVGLVQWGAGLLACAAVAEIGRQVGFTRFWRLAAVLVLLGVPTTSTQFFTSQTDLFTAGCLAVGLAFLLPALRNGRAGDWVLVGAGAGLAIGTKGTVLYWGPGLVILLVAWALIERSRPGAVVRGAGFALLVVLPLCSYNFLQNSRNVGNPFAPPRAMAWVQRPPEQRVGRTLLDLAQLVWQTLEPGSNPMIPRAVREPAARALLRFLAAHDTSPADVLRRARWLEKGLSEDYASFGLLVALAGAAGGVLSLFRLRIDRASRYLAAVFAASTLFVLAFCWIQVVTVHEFRYLSLVTPFLALLAAYALAIPRGRPGRLFVTAFLALQFVTALDVGYASVHHGLGALRDPGSTPWYPHWRDSRALIGQLGTTPRVVGIAMQNDSWLAPFFRTGVSHRFEQVTLSEVSTYRSLGELLAGRGLDALIIDPLLTSKLAMDDVWVYPAPDLLHSRRLLVRRLAEGESPRPSLVAALGLTYGAWTRPDAYFDLANWRTGVFALRLSNPTRLRRELEARSGRELLRLALLPGATTDLILRVNARDKVQLRVSPPFVPTSSEEGSDDARGLGLLVAPSKLVVDRGLFRDGWTATAVELRLVNWISGVLELAVANPTGLERELELRGSLGSVRRHLAPGERTTISLVVLPLDTVALTVTPGFVPSESSPRSTDARTLGIQLDPLTFQPPREGVFR